MALEVVLDGFGKTARVSAGRWVGMAETGGSAVFNGAGDCAVLRSVDILGELWSLGRAELNNVGGKRMLLCWKGEP